MTGGALTRRAAALRRRARRNRWLAHLVRAGVRYDQADGGRLAAAITYYAFFATFALTLLGFAVFGFVLDNPAVAASVQRYITQNPPRLDVQSLRHARGTVGIIAFVGPAGHRLVLGRRPTLIDPPDLAATRIPRRAARPGP